MNVDKIVMEMAIEMIQPVAEAFGKGFKVLMGEWSKEYNTHLMQAQKYAKAKQEYQQCLVYIKKGRAEASKIEDETLLDWIASLFIKPTVFLSVQMWQSNFDLKGLTRESTLRYFDQYESLIKREMAKLK